VAGYEEPNTRGMIDPAYSLSWHVKWSLELGERTG
jgi:hypothetical protein